MDYKSIASPMVIEDYESAATFLEKATRGVYKKELWLDRFECWWDNNPVMNNDINRGWVLRDVNEEIGGFMGNVPIKYYIRGEEQIACIATSWYVSNEHNKRGLDLLLPFLKQKRRILLDTTASERAAEILLKLGFTSLEKEWLKEEFFYPVDIAEFLDFFVRKTFTNSVVFRSLKWVSIFIAPVLKTFLMLLRINVFLRLGEYSFREITRFDETYTSLWEKFKLKYDMLAVRDSSALNWFFFGSNGLSSTRKVLEIRRCNEVIGYVAVKEASSFEGGRDYSYFEIIDVVMCPEEESAYITVIDGLLWLARQSKKKIMFIRATFFSESMKQGLRRYGFFKRAGISRFVYKQQGDSCSIKPSAFYATTLDGDRCFFP